MLSITCTEEKVMAPKTKSKRQVGYLLSKGSPLTGEQQEKLKGELHSGKVKVEKGPKKPPKGMKFGKAPKNKRH